MTRVQFGLVQTQYSYNSELKSQNRRRVFGEFFRSTVASSGSSGLSRRKQSASASTPPSAPTRIVYRERVPPSHPDLPFWQRNWFIALLFVMAIGFFSLALFLFLGLDLHQGSPSSASAASSEGVEITYGTVLKLMHEKTKFRLHSHDVPYGSGSGQQSVTGYPNVDDANSYWVNLSPSSSYSFCGTNVVICFVPPIMLVLIVRPELGTSAKQGDPIKSGTIIRFQHMGTRKWLHSHLHASPISGNLEVSCFGDDSNSDTGDYWKLVIEGSGKTWKQGQRIRLQHVDTGGYLHSHNKKYSRTAGGQQEVCGVREKRADNVWLAAEGVYLPVMETK
ncbi:Stromal cell-derived factor 2-like protein, partial [Cucurbita argyrosperma subsp. argyrosperma]